MPTYVFDRVGSKILGPKTTLRSQGGQDTVENSWPVVLESGVVRSQCSALSALWGKLGRRRGGWD